MKILCADEQKPRYVVSKVGPKFMNEIHTIEITNEHEVVVGCSYKT